MQRSLSVLALCFAVASGPLTAQPADYPFIGKWDCEVAVFTFTAATYNNGSEDLPITKIAEDRGNFILDFADGYQIGVSAVTETSMSWISMASGDMFDCTRIE